MLLSFSASAQKGWWLSGDTLRYVNGSGDTVQINKLVPAMTNNAGKVLSNDGRQYTWITNSGLSRTFLANNVVNNNATPNTLADVTGLSFDFTANTTYAFKFFIVYSSAATTTGSRWAINGPATTFMNYRSHYTLSATSITNNAGLSAYNTPSGASASSLTSNNIAIIEGIIRPSANGTVIARFASEITASAITAVASGKSYVEYQAIN